MDIFYNVYSIIGMCITYKNHGGGEGKEMQAIGRQWCKWEDDIERSAKATGGYSLQMIFSLEMAQDWFQKREDILLCMNPLDDIIAGCMFLLCFSHYQIFLAIMLVNLVTSLLQFNVTC